MKATAQARSMEVSVRAAACAVVLLCACVGPSEAPIEADYSSPVVLFVSADEAEVERMKGQLGEDFWTVADDSMWYRAEAFDLVMKRGIAHKQVGRGRATFLVGDEVKEFSWAEDERPWFVVYYDGEHEPRALFDIELPEAVGDMDPNMTPGP